MELSSAEHRCRIDPEFAALVALIESFIERLQYTASEVREAAIRCDMRSLKPVFMQLTGEGYE